MKMKVVKIVSAALSTMIFAGCMTCESVRTISVEDYRDKMAGGWFGQIIGVTYGWPTEFKKAGTLFEDKELPVWTDATANNCFGQDDLYVEMTFLNSLDKRGIDVSSRKAGIDFANSKYRLWCANHNGRNNLRRGIAAPSSSHPKNHPSTDDIDYQIEADFSGIISPGMPQRAVKLGEQFGRIMNYGDGLYAGQFIGGMYAEAFFETDRVKTVEAGLKCIPQSSKYAQMVRDMLEWYKADPIDWKKAWKLAVDKYGTKDSPMVGKVSFPAIDVKINGACVLLGYLWGDGDIMKTAKISTAAGYDSDCNPSSSVGVLGVQIGYKNLGPEYTAKFIRDVKWEFTDYDFDTLLAVSEKITRKIIVAEGGRIEGKDGKEIFVLPLKNVVPSEAVDSKNPGPGGDERLTEAEMSEILYKPTKNSGDQSEKK
jgi:hypothetical protein